MTDNTVLPTGAGGDTVRTIDRGAAKTQVLVIDVGGEAGPESLVIPGNPLPVTDAKTPTLGQAPSTGSLPVVLASDQSPIPVQFPAGSAVPVANDPQGGPLSVQLSASDLNSIINPVTINGAVTANSPVPSLVTGQINNANTIIGPFVLNGATRITIMQFGTYSGLTVTSEVSNDGVTWSGVRPFRPVTAFIESGPAYALGVNSTQANIVDVGGWLYYRYRSSAYTSGILNVAIAAGSYSAPAMINSIVSGTAAEGATATGTPVRIAGWDGTLIRTLFTDVNGQLVVNQGVAGATPWPVLASGTVSISGFSAANPLPVQISDGSKSQDLLSAIQALIIANILSLRFAANAAEASGAGFIPVEIPSFLGA